MADGSNGQGNVAANGNDSSYPLHYAVLGYALIVLAIGGLFVLVVFFLVWVHPTTYEYKLLPPVVSNRLQSWQASWFWANVLYYALGIVGVVASTLAASTLWSRPAGIVSAVCFAVLGFIQPRDVYLRYVNAWRILIDPSDQYIVQQIHPTESPMVSLKKLWMRWPRARIASLLRRRR